jgi:hypothetical protein
MNPGVDPAWFIPDPDFTFQCIPESDPVQAPTLEPGPSKNDKFLNISQMPAGSSSFAGLRIRITSQRPAGSSSFAGLRIRITLMRIRILLVTLVHPQNVRFQNVRIQKVWFQNVRFQNVRFTKRQV